MPQIDASAIKQRPAGAGRLAGNYNAILCTYLAGVIMHGPGLKVKWEYEDWPEYFESLCGAAAEGAFLLLLATRMHGVGRRLCRRLSSLSSRLPSDDPNDRSTNNRDGKRNGHSHAPGPSDTDWCRKRMLRSFVVVAAIVFPVWCFTFTLSAILIDATYRTMSGNESPTNAILQVGRSDVKANVTAQLTHDPLGSLCRTLFGLACVGGSVLWMHTLRSPSSSRVSAQRRNHHHHDVSSDGSREGLFIFGHGVAACCLNFLSWYTPVIFAFFSFFSFDGTEDYRQMHAVSNITMRNVNQPAPSGGVLPNIIFIQYESLSGSVMLNTDEGVAAMPFFQNKMHNDTDFYVFEAMRSVSGNTIDAIPAMTTGCLPHTVEAVAWAQTVGRSLGYEFSERYSGRGYATASFSARAFSDSITWVKGPYHMLHDPFAGGMGRLVEPLGLGYRMENAESTDDRKILPFLEEWIREVDGNATADATGENKQKTPFYAQLYLTNTHYPYLKDYQTPSFSHRYFDALATTDQTFEHLFRILEKTGHLEDTIIIGSGDHGEDPFKEGYVRVASLNSNVLQVASYIYYPKRLMPDPNVAERLRRNTRKMTHILDIRPTIEGIVSGSSGVYDALQHTPEGCITGIDLTSVDVPDERVTMSINLASSSRVQGTRFNVPWQARLWALHTIDAKGRELSLYHRRHKFKHPALQQGTDNFYILVYGECTRNISAANLCMEDVSDEHKETFRKAVQWLKHTPSYHEGVKNSELVETFRDHIGNQTSRSEHGYFVTARKYDNEKNVRLVRNTLIGWAMVGCIALHVIRSYRGKSRLGH